MPFPSRSVILALCVASAPVVAQDADDKPDYRIPDLPTAQIDEGLEIGGEEIEARKVLSRMTVEVMVDGSGPHKFVVDSGADTSVIGSNLAHELGLARTSPVLLHAITESKVVERVAVDSLTLGPTTTTDLELPVLRERDIGGDGMIGLDALVEQRLMLDFEKRVITVDDGTSREAFAGGVIVVTARKQRGQLILTEVEAGRERIEAVVDTGTEVSIGNSVLRDLLNARSPESLQKVTVYGVTGKPQELEFAILPRLKIGPILLQKVPVAFADVPPFGVFGIEETPSLLLGTDLMEQFRRVSLDFRDSKVRFQLRQCQNDRARLRTSSRLTTRIRSERESACAR